MKSLLRFMRNLPETGWAGALILLFIAAILGLVVYSVIAVRAAFADPSMDEPITTLTKKDFYATLIGLAVFIMLSGNIWCSCSRSKK